MKLRISPFFGRRPRAASARLPVPSEVPQPAPAPLPAPARAGWSEPALLPLPAGSPPVVAVAILALGLRGEELAALADAVLASLATQRCRPVFLTDTLDPTPLRQRSLPFEYLPALPPAGHPPEAYDRLLLARMAVWRRKWRLARIVTAGPKARRRLEAWHASGDMPPALAELLTGVSEMA